MNCFVVAAKSLLVLTLSFSSLLIGFLQQREIGFIAHSILKRLNYKMLMTRKILNLNFLAKTSSFFFDFVGKPDFVDILVFTDQKFIFWRLGDSRNASVEISDFATLY